MDNIKNYQKILSVFFRERVVIQNDQQSGLKAHLIINESKTDFLLIKTGWANKLFVHTISFHIEIKEGKVWIYENKTDIDLAKILTERGISKEDIVLGYLSPALRQLSEYGQSEMVNV